VWKHQPRLLEKLPNLKVIFSAGAGVDHLANDPGLPDVPIVRVVAEISPDIWSTMLCGASPTITGRACSIESSRPKNLVRSGAAGVVDITVGIMGLGNLGRAAAKALLAIGYKVNGWSRTPQQMTGVTTFAGEAG
jgi:glyoxylate/hydroxypyruvate reductase A